MNIASSFWQYLARSQNPSTRLIHLLIATLVIIQIIDSNFMHTKHGLNIGAYCHIILGLITGILTCMFVISQFNNRGIKYFYPYCFKHFDAIKQDITLLLRKKLPCTKPGGLAAIVQGLGLGAICLVFLSGLAWLIAWYCHMNIAPSIKSLHKSLTTLIEVYIIGHGVMGLLHYILDLFKSRSTDNP